MQLVSLEHWDEFILCKFLNLDYTPRRWVIYVHCLHLFRDSYKVQFHSTFNFFVFRKFKHQTFISEKFLKKYYEGYFKRILESVPKNNVYNWMEQEYNFYRASVWLYAFVDFFIHCAFLSGHILSNILVYYWINLTRFQSFHTCCRLEYIDFCNELLVEIRNYNICS